MGCLTLEGSPRSRGGGGGTWGSSVSMGEAAVLGARGAPPPQHGVSDQLRVSKLDVGQAQK